MDNSKTDTALTILLVVSIAVTAGLKAYFGSKSRG